MYIQKIGSKWYWYEYESIEVPSRYIRPATWLEVLWYGRVRKWLRL